MTDLTDRQREVLRFINAHRSKEQCNPTMQEIAANFGWGSSHTVRCHIDAMVRKGVIRTRAGKSRGYVVSDQYTNAGQTAREAA